MKANNASIFEALPAFLGRFQLQKLSPFITITTTGIWNEQSSDRASPVPIADRCRMQASGRVLVPGVRLASVDCRRLLPQVRGVRETATARRPGLHDRWSPAAGRRQRTQAAGAGLPGAGRTRCISRHGAQLMQGGIWCRGHFLPGAAGAGVHSSSARRGRSEPSSIVVSAPQCVGNATVDCRNRRFGLIRLNRSESAWLARGRRRVETQIRVNASSLRGIRPATGGQETTTVEDSA